MGVVSVSPVARQQTSVTMNDMATAIRPRNTLIWNARSWTMTNPIVIGIIPIMSQDAGTSMASSCSFVTAEVYFRKMLKDLASVRHCRATDTILENTIMEVPPHKAQRTGLNIPAGFTLNEGT